MWLLAIIPAAAAAIIGLVTWMSPEIPRWKRWLVISLTVASIGAIGIGAWLGQHDKQVQDARRTAIIETLGAFIAEGQRLQSGLSSSPQTPVADDKFRDWIQRTANFLDTLGRSYVIRFMSDAGLETSLSPTGADDIHKAYWLALRNRLTRLHEFSSEFSAQLPIRTSSSF